MTAEVKVYSTTFCPYCVRAKQLLERKGVAYTEINLDKEEPEVRLELTKKTNHRTVPQIFINDQFIGGFDQLYALEKEGKLNDLLA
ncbi:glutaredoxin 3 [Acinetobacter sp. TY1]|uniref:glutaredoxin 3 n=1 Tax=unclassified Acinetobacter TaxID=196816 RepID=UPI00303C03E6